MAKIASAFWYWFEYPLRFRSRTFLCLPIAILTVYLGMQRYKINSVFAPFWERDFSDLWHGLTGFGHSGVVEYQMPGGVVGVIAACLAFFVALKGLAYFPGRLNMHFLFLAVMDFFVFAILVNLFVFSGTAFELLMYAGCFLVGALVFGNRITGQIALLSLMGILLIRLVYMDSIHLYLFYIPLLGLLYIFLRAPFESEGFREELRGFSLRKVIARG